MPPPLTLPALARHLWARLASAFESAPPGSLRVTGLLGLVVALYLAWSWGDRPKPPDAVAGPDAPRAPLPRIRPGTATGAGAPGRPATPMTPASAALRARLGGARVVTLSVPGLLLEEWEAEELESGATLRPGVAAAVRSLASAVPGGVYLVARVSGDIGEAAVRAALEAGGILGGGRGVNAAALPSTSTAATVPPASPRPHPPIPPQRLLFCESVTGKVALARQLEAGLHIDGCGATIDELARFVPRLVYVGRGGGEGSGSGSSGPTVAGVVRAASLVGALGL